MDAFDQRAGGRAVGDGGSAEVCELLMLAALLAAAAAMKVRI